MDGVITLQELIELRKQVVNGYEDYMEEKLILTNTKSNKYYDALITAMEDVLGSDVKNIPKKENLKKFFFNDEYLSYTPNVIKNFRDFVRLTKLKKGEKKLALDELNYTGFLFVTVSFLKNIESRYNFSPNDFYTDLRDENCQWFGIINKWYCKRNKFINIKKEVSQSFNHKAKVAAVIIGDGGTGKTTLLRKLATELIDRDFIIVWVTDPIFFCNNHLLTILNKKEKYLLIIHDWSKISRDNNTVMKFLNLIDNVQNIRLVIGDHKVSRSYYRYIRGENIFKISTEENERILTEIFEYYEPYKQIGNYLIQNTNISNSPLFIGLFVIGRLYERNLASDLLKIDSIESEFKQMLLNDLIRISEIYPGLALAFYYFASLHKQYEFLITWDIFLNIVEHYQPDLGIRYRLARFDKEDPVCEILSHLISLKYYKYFVKTGFWIAFHHDILLEGITSSIEDQLESVFPSWHRFGVNIVNEILNVLPQDENGNTLLFLR